MNPRTFSWAIRHLRLNIFWWGLRLHYRDLSAGVLLLSGCLWEMIVG